MPPYNPYEDTWDEHSVTKETHIDAKDDTAPWINDAKDRTHSIISNLDCSEEPSKLSEFYDSETFKSRFGQEAKPGAQPALTIRTLHLTPTITEGQETISHVCSCCQLPRAPTTSQDTPLSPLLHAAKDMHCACYCPDIKMPKEMMDSPPSQKPHIRRNSSLSNAETLHWHRKHDGALECADRETVAKSEMSIGAWL